MGNVRSRLRPLLFSLSEYRIQVVDDDGRVSHFWDSREIVSARALTETNGVAVLTS